MTELEKMQRAKMYIDKLANGINPIDDAAAPENDVINNVRLSRCFFYVSDILRQVIENGGTAKAIKSAPKSPFFLTDEQKNQYIPSDKPISVSEITKALNAIADLEKCKKLSYSLITEWLISIGALELRNSFDGKAKKYPTPQGVELGITNETRNMFEGKFGFPCQIEDDPIIKLVMHEDKSMQDDGISHTAIGIDEPVQSLRHIPSCNTEGLTCRRETVDLVLEERCRRFYLRPFQLADNLGCVQHIIKDIRNVSQALLVLPEDQFRIDREIQPSQKEDQLLVALDRPEQINKVTVVVVEDFSFCLWLAEEDLSAAHTGFDVNAVLRHHCQDRVDDATLVSCVGQWAG